MTLRRGSPRHFPFLALMGWCRLLSPVSSSSSSVATISSVSRIGRGGANVARWKSSREAANPVILETTTVPTATDNLHSTTTPTRRLNTITFLFVFSSALTSLTPAPALTRVWGAARTTTVLSLVTGAAALMELVGSAPLGAWLDRAGRKPAILVALTAVPAVHAWVSVTTALSAHQSSSTSVPSLSSAAVWSLVAAKGVSLLSFTVFTLTTQAMLSDWSLQLPSIQSNTTQKDNGTTQKWLSSAMGVNMAATGMAFMLAIVGAGALHQEGHPARVYGTSAVVGSATAFLAWFTLPETLLPVPLSSATVTTPSFHTPASTTSQRISSVLSALLAAARLLRTHGPQVRVLAILLLLLTLPMNQGDMFQVYSRHEWQLDTPAFSNYLALYGCVSIFANICASRLLPSLGTKSFTLVAIASRLVSIVMTIAGGYKGAVIGVVLGFLGAAQSIGILGALVSAAAKSGMAPGALAGERSALLALLKVVGPLLYSTLYIQGSRVGRPNVPLYFNVVVSCTAWIVAWAYLT